MIYYFSIESRKGGVGKTTVALNLGAKLLEMKYKVLLLDCDITGTSISVCSKTSIYWKDTVHVIKKKLDKKDVAVNLLDYFKNCYLIGKEEAWTKKDGSPYDSSRLNVIGTELYDEEHLVIDPRVLMDELHSFWVVSMLQELSENFSKSGDRNQNTAIIIDNSPGYAGLGRAVHEWLSDIGPQYARFLLVSSLDEQDIKSSVYSLKEIKRLVEGKVRVKKYYDLLENADSPASLNENEEEHFLKSDGCFDRFFYKLASGYIYKSDTGRDYRLKDYAAIVFNKVSEDFKHPDFYYDFKEVLTEENTNLVEELFGGGEISSYRNFMIPYDYNIHLQFFGHRLKNQKSGTETYWRERFRKFKVNVSKRGKFRDVVKASFQLDNLMKSLKVSMEQKGLRKMADSIQDRWLIGGYLHSFSNQVTTIAFYNKPDNRLDFSDLDKKTVMGFNLQLESILIKKKDLENYEPILTSMFGYLYTLAGAKKTSRDIRLLITVSVFCNVLRSVFENDFNGTDFEHFLQEQCKRSMSGGMLKKYVGEYVPVTENITLPTDAFQGVFGKCFEEFYQTICYAILRMIYRFDNFLLLSDVLEMLILSGQYREIPTEVAGMLDDMIVTMLKPRDSKAFERLINDKLRMTDFESVINHIIQMDWKL